MPKIIRFVFPLIIAWIIALMVNPLVRFLENKIKIMRKHGSAIVIILLLVGVCGLLYLITTTLVTQLSSMIQALPDIYSTVIDNIQLALKSLHSKINIIPDDIEMIFADNDNKINDYILTALNSLQDGPVATVSSVASSIIDIFILSILTLMISYFFIADNDSIKKSIEKLTPEPVMASFKIIKDTVLRAIGGYLKACFQIMIIIFAILFVFFYFIGVEYAALLALITSILDFLPFIGTGTVIMPWALYSVITGKYATAVLLIIAYLVTMLARRLLEPKLVGDSIGLSPFYTLISMFIGYRLMGMLGLILGIPIGMILKVFYEEGLFDNTIRGIKILIHDINEYRKF